MTVEERVARELGKAIMERCAAQQAVMNIVSKLVELGAITDEIKESMPELKEYLK